MPELTLLRIILSIVSGGVIGFFIGMTGIGGGVLVWPTLVFLLGVDPVAGLGTALFYALITKIFAVVAHWRQDNVARDAAGWCVVGTAPGVIAAALAISELKERFPEPTDAAVKLAVGAVILLSLGLMSWNTFRRGGEAQSAQPDGSQHKSLRLKGTGFGLLFGLVMGATSIGGGVLILPVLILWFGMTARRAAGTSIAISIAAAVCGSVVYQKYGQVAWAIAVLMFAGSLPAVWLGSRVAGKVPGRVLRWVMLGLMLVAALVTLLARKPG